jgi:hypothetical protein
MSNAYLVFAEWGCFEVESGSVDEWFSDPAAARKRYDNIAKEYRQRAMSEAALIDRSPHLIWTSDEYFFTALVCIQEVNLEKGQPDELSAARLKSRIEKGGYDVAGEVVHFTGQTWGEDGEGAYDGSDMLERIMECHGF